MLTDPSWSLGAGLEGRGVIVTGAASGIGRATARMMAAAGARVAAVDVDRDGLDETMVTLEGRDDHLAIRFDLAETASIPDLFGWCFLTVLNYRMYRSLVGILCRT